MDAPLGVRRRRPAGGRLGRAARPLVLGLPFGISERKLDEIHQSLSTLTGVAITVVPPLAGLLVLGLVQRWGSSFPLGAGPGRSTGSPAAGDDPGGVVALALVTYGVLSVTVFVGQLLAGDLPWSDVWDGWAVSATLLVFLGWGVALGVTTTGYALATSASGPGSPGSTTRTSTAPARDDRSIRGHH
ncbi:hypothetical protein NKG94_50020 [Micromonospora sp. M12]